MSRTVVSFEDFPPLGRTCRIASTDDYNGPRCMGYFQLIGFGAPPHHSVPTLVHRTDHPSDRGEWPRTGVGGSDEIWTFWQTELNTQHMDTF